jgi:citrate synthase
MHHTMVHEKVKQFMDGFLHDAHPMVMLISSMAALATFYPDSRDLADPAVRDLQIRRAIAKVPTLAAYAYRHSQGRFYVYPDNELSFTGNFLSMLWKLVEPSYRPNPILGKALNILFILHMDHEQNCEPMPCAWPEARWPISCAWQLGQQRSPGPTVAPTRLPFACLPRSAARTACPSSYEA